MVWLCLAVVLAPFLIPYWIIRAIVRSARNITWLPYETEEEEPEIVCKLDVKEMQRQRQREKKRELAELTIEHMAPEAERLKREIERETEHIRMMRDVGSYDFSAEKRMEKLKKQLFTTETKLIKAKYDLMEDAEE